MPRPQCVGLRGYCYHVLSRGNARQRIFHKVPGATGEGFRSPVLLSDGDVMCLKSTGGPKLPPVAPGALLRQALDGMGTGQIAHHIIPLEALKEFEFLVKQAASGGFNFNGEANGILLDAARIALAIHNTIGWFLIACVDCNGMGLT